MRLDVGWAAIRPNKDQIPGSCRNWFPVQRFVDVSGAKYGVTWASLDAPMVEIERLTANLSGLGPNGADFNYHDPKYWMEQALESPTIYSFVMNNHWGTNYCADQQGLVEFRYSIHPHGAYRPLEAAVRHAGESAASGQRGRTTIGGGAARDDRRRPRVIATSLRPSRDGKA